MGELSTLLENFYIYRYIVFTFYVSKYTLCIPIYMEVFWQCKACVRPSSPFERLGVDYAGPMNLRLTKTV